MTSFDKAFEQAKQLVEKFKCNSLDRQIDKLVYQLHGLTDKEIKIVEAG
jgi:hypothetical protein